MTAHFRATAEDSPPNVTAEGLDPGAHRFAIAFGCTLLVLFVAWFGILIAVDPRSEFFGSRFPAVTPNTRADKLSRLQEFAASESVKTIVFGSSRTFAIAPADLLARGYGRSFSLTVHGGGVRDLLALYRETRRLGVHADAVVIGVDLTWLSRSFEDAYELSHSRPLQAALSADRRPPSRVTHALSLAERMLTVGYALDARRSLTAWINRVPPRFLTDTAGRTWQPEADVRIASGGEEAMGAIHGSAPSALPPLIGYAGPDSLRAEVLLEFLRVLRADSVVVHAYLTPYHPAALDLIHARPRARDGFDRSRADLKSLFARAGVPLLDFNDATAFGASADEWYDANHMQAPNGARLIEALGRRGL